MKKSKKWIVVLVCLALFAMMALGSSSVALTSNDKGGTSSDGASKEIKNDETKENNNDTDDVTDVRSTTIEKQVLVEQDGIVITANEYIEDSIWGEGIKLLIENNSEKSVTVGCKALIVNDYMITDLFAANVAAGKKSNETMYLSSLALKAAGIDSVGQVKIYLHVYDSETFSEIFDTDAVIIQTSQFENMDTTPNDAGTELYNEGGVKIIGKTVDENSFWGTAVLLYIENNSGKNIGVMCEDMSINGFMTTPYFSSQIYDGKKSIDEITIFSSDLEKNGIKSIDEIELKFHIYDADTFSTIKDTDPISFSAK